ncbi:ABC transporter ATP-binding protein [Paenibacillus antri]|uniref:ABC transporter ATP-binding protein n=1 Tax=Paenibacillus antri TaxID=2582848 RepID=A0A5R9G5V2_9BACL|nr:ABC transporter ATP-binding protein [Paenibacillus antri]TLS51161.1 ABC transporter ATP-binding protein [Paenibacillus antri]
MRDIHQEREVAKLGDSQLLGRLIRYATPYWKPFALCVLLAFLVVAADLGRTFLISVAIDDHINGYRQPMVAAESRAELERRGFEPLPGDTGERAYARVGWDAAEPPGDLAKAQIVEAGDGTYLVAGWLPSEAEGGYEVTPGADGAASVTTEDGSALQATALSPDQVDAFQAGDAPAIWRLGGLFLIAVVGAALLSVWQMNLLQFTGQRILYTIRDQLFRHIGRMPMSFFDRNPVGRLVVRVTQDTEALNNLFTQVLVTLVKDVLVLIGIVGVMFYLNAELALLTLCVLPVLAAMTFWYKAVIREAQRITRTILSRLNSFLAENLSGMRITQMFVREHRQWQQFDELNEGYYRAGMRGTVINSIFQPAIGFVGNLAVALLLWYGGLRVLDGALQFGVVFAFTIYVRQFFNPLMSLAEKFGQVQTAMVGAERIFDLLDEKPAMTETANPVALPQPLKGEIRFENVWFAYNGEEWVLRDVSFVIRPGQTVAFVGATGAGKSSIIQLINRFYDIQKGRILLDGVDIRELPIADLRRAVGIVQQDVFLFTGTIASNIRLNETDITDEQVREAAKRVRMDEFVRSMPEGYDTLLGERGVTLSLGQRQLLSFARAIVFRPQVLILDEATSNIDTDTEIVVQEALAELSRGRTTLVVAHRLSTIQHADQIIVMHKGKVRETGNHAELLSQGGYYYRLHQLQYKDRQAAAAGAAE